MNGTTNHTANENTSENNFSNSWMDHPAMKGMDPVKLELIRLAAKQTAGKSSRYDGAHHQCEQERNPVHSTGNVSHPRHSERRTFQRRTKSDRPDGADGPYTHEKQYLISFRSQICAKKKDSLKPFFFAHHTEFSSLFSLFPFFFFFFRLKFQSWRPDRFVILIQCYHCKIRMIDRCTLPT